MKRYLGTALALLALAQGCSGGGDDGSGYGDGTCTPTVQTAPDPAGAQAFCLGFVGAICDRGFTDCRAEIGIAPYFASAADCAAQLGAGCAADASSQWYDAPCGAACLSYARGAPCSAFVAAEPQACAVATGSFAPACVGAIAVGQTITDTIGAADPLYDGGHARAYCVTLAAGQSVVVWTAAPASGTPLSDSVLHLIGPDGSQVAYDDDGGTGLYSMLYATAAAAGEYRIVVRGFSSSLVGAFDLGVAAN